jgi:pyruvate/2-oxoglutarate dehydrogenase complex dihydrolipoamide acyltransferase (E2) component
MDIIMPQLGETVLEGLITAWHKKPGDVVSADEKLFDVETDKVSTEIPSPITGVLREILVEAGISVKVGTRLATVEAAPLARPKDGEMATPASSAPPQLEANAARNLSPVVRRLLGEAGLTADQVRGSGREGRITREDVLEHLANAKVRGASVSVDEADDRVVPLNKIRRATAAHMLRSVATSPHALQAVEVDFHGVERARKAIADDWKAQEGFTLTYLPFLCAAVCRAMIEFPLINASFGNDALIVHRRIHLGIAVDLAFDGLMVPVLRDANRRDVRGLAIEIHSLIRRARANTLLPDDVNGGTYTISNSGSFGTLITAPIINQPQVAILSLDGVHKKPVVLERPDGDSIAIRPIGVLAQSFDHRAFDGAYSAAFLRRLKQVVEAENWQSILR